MKELYKIHNFTLGNNIFPISLSQKLSVLLRAVTAFGNVFDNGNSNIESVKQTPYKRKNSSQAYVKCTSFRRRLKARFPQNN